MDLTFLEHALFRFALSGTLITVYSVADVLARRHGRDPRPARVKSPRWLHPVIFVSVTAFYLLIGPTGGLLAGGLGNLAGIVLVGVASALRWWTRRGTASVRYPEVAARMLFYVALPLAVGVPWGWVALTLPACAVSAWATVREDRIQAEIAGTSYRERMAVTSRWVPGVW
jgi:protein-S-isoprenylcysteine O-methyltransferase Ste14